MDVQASIEGRRSFHYFRSCDMSGLPGNFEPYFWNHIVLQLSHGNPAVLQAVITLSAMHEQHDPCAQDPSRTALGNGFALQQYNKAVKSLIQYLALEEQDPRIALTACLIFVWIEILQDNMSTAFQHLNSGLKILRDVRTVAGTKVTPLYRDAEDIVGSLDRSFTRLRIQAAIHGAIESDFTTSTTRELEVIEPGPRTFFDIFESRNALDKEFNAIFGCMREWYESGYDDALLFVEHRNAHLARLDEWEKATQCMTTALDLRKDQIQSRGFLISRCIVSSPQ